MRAMDGGWGLSLERLREPLLVAWWAMRSPKTRLPPVLPRLHALLHKSVVSRSALPRCRVPSRLVCARRRYGRRRCGLIRCGPLRCGLHPLPQDAPRGRHAPRHLRAPRHPRARLPRRAGALIPSHWKTLPSNSIRLRLRIARCRATPIGSRPNSIELPNISGCFLMSESPSKVIPIPMALPSITKRCPSDGLRRRPAIWKPGGLVPNALTSLVGARPPQSLPIAPRTDGPKTGGSFC